MVNDKAKKIVYQNGQDKLTPGDSKLSQKPQFCFTEFTCYQIPPPPSYYCYKLQTTLKEDIQIEALAITYTRGEADRAKNMSFAFNLHLFSNMIMVRRKNISFSWHRHFRHICLGDIQRRYTLKKQLVEISAFVRN